MRAISNANSENAAWTRALSARAADIEQPPQSGRIHAMTEDRQQQIAQLEALLRQRFPDSARRHLEAALNILYEDVVKVYPLEVTAERDDWPEAAQRDRRWFPALEAAELVAEPELAKILRGFDPA